MASTLQFLEPQAPDRSAKCDLSAPENGDDTSRCMDVHGSQKCYTRWDTTIMAKVSDYPACCFGTMA